MATHHVEPDRRTVHGDFDAEHEPILAIESGDTVVYRTIDASWGHAGELLFGIKPPDLGKKVDGHALCGPVSVRGARPGDALEVQIGTIRPEAWGSTYVGPQHKLGDGREVRIGWRLDPDEGLATDTSGLGLRVPLNPFLGVMGNAPVRPGSHPTGPPRRVGGNLDCRELVTGATLWLPVEVQGALFSVGDGHALQGDGEVCGTAIECPMQHVELTFAVRADLDIDAPQAETPGGFITFGLGSTLDEAAYMATRSMLDHLQKAFGLGRSEALALASLVVNLRVTQIVNGTLGVHAILPPNALERAPAAS